METVTVWIGTVIAGNSGITNDSRRRVRFEGEELATRREWGTGRPSCPPPGGGGWAEFEAVWLGA